MEREKLLRINYYATSTPFQSYCQSRNNRELRIRGDIDVIFSARCAVARVTGLIRDVQEIFLIKERGESHVQPIYPNFPLNSAINCDQENYLFRKLYTASIGFFSCWRIYLVQLWSRLDSRRWLMDDRTDDYCRSIFTIELANWRYILRLLESFLYVETSFRSKPSQSHEEKLILTSMAPDWIQSVLKQPRSFFRFHEGRKSITLLEVFPLHHVNPRIVSRYRNQATTCRFQRRPSPLPHAKSRTYAMERRTIIETPGKYQSRVTEGEII